jgi:hypothetical protein
MENLRCFNCSNYLSDLKCQAFPLEIPDEIMLGENDHSKPLKDQPNDIVFEELKKITNDANLLK